MKNLKNNLPAILFVLFELAVGILLLLQPEKFTAAVIIIFGAVLIAVGAVYLIGFFRSQNQYGGASPLTLVASVVSLAIGCICVFLTEAVIGLFAAVAVIYGVILIVSGIFKAKGYMDAKKALLPVSKITIISAVISIVLGTVIVINPFGTVNALWIFAGISLIFEGVLDFIAIVRSANAEYVISDKVEE